MAQDAEKTREKLEAVYRLYQRNIRAVDPIVYEITLGARNGTSEEELLKKAMGAVEALDFGDDLDDGED